MTVIAAFHYPDFPMVFGDMLLSGPEQIGQKFAIPSVGEIRNFFPEGSGWTITGLVQKIAIVADNCVVAWAGSRLGAQIAISELRSIAATENLLPETIRNFLDDLNIDTRNLGTSLIGFIRTDSGFESFSYEASSEIKMTDGTSVKLAGSGADTLSRFLLNTERTRLRTDDSLVHPAQRAYELGLQLGASHLRMEEANDDLLLQYFGGCYEVAVFNGERFTKDRGVTFVLWSGKEPDATGFARPDHIITTNYVDDVLFLRSQKLKWENGLKFKSDHIQIHVVEPIYRQVDLAVPPTPSSISQHTPWICHGILAKGQDGNVRRMAIVERLKHDGTDNFSIEVNQGVIVNLNWKKQFWLDFQAAVDMGAGSHGS